MLIKKDVILKICYINFLKKEKNECLRLRSIDMVLKKILQSTIYTPFILIQKEQVRYGKVTVQNILIFVICILFLPINITIFLGEKTCLLSTF